MKGYRCYLRAVILSIIAAFLLDAAINFEAYKQEWTTVFRQEQPDVDTGSGRGFPEITGKVTRGLFGIYRMK